MIAGGLALLALTVGAGNVAGRADTASSDATGAAAEAGGSAHEVGSDAPAATAGDADDSIAVTTASAATESTGTPSTDPPSTGTSQTAPPPTEPPTTMPPVQLGPDGTTPTPLGRAPTWFGQPILYSNRVFVFGDSVILGAKSALPDKLTGWEVVVDAAESRFEHEAPGILGRRRAEIGRVAVILIGHNSGAGYNHEPWIRGMLDELTGVERIVFLTAVEWGPGPVDFNATLRRLAPEYPNVVIADWNAASQAHPEYTFDGLHLLGPGQQALSDLVASYVGPLPPPG